MSYLLKHTIFDYESRIYLVCGSFCMVIKLFLKYFEVTTLSFIFIGDIIKNWGQRGHFFLALKFSSLMVNSSSSLEYLHIVLIFDNIYEGDSIFYSAYSRTRDYLTKVVETLNSGLKSLCQSFSCLRNHRS